ncbi:hypothetical protein TREMEDRAFT_62439 [Tremella mesenterica DSM 1558]|uniref:uncharacterized protein n=1 Tax=Tremella mesenterica (strain ATCC 24925 / CBS 8224 / DSM 1558 / NBRC 9311 / NRRL Y-6157 / RJB 2259-6 / UBC 559-6) TaxID=578456 RepID=UPI0003F49D23|nr:uncharacterized protein TREMEDRAFT_62439 [Tremella mesenterica DSM 1558]EIW69579.1 hypothetical protein TREMEDRAFT_62439 [Tremella mesenterica DSM 1558]
MLFNKLAFVFTALIAIPIAMGRVYNMSAPTTLQVGKEFTAVLYTEGYITNWEEFGVVWGLKNKAFDCTMCEGSVIGYDSLYKSTPGNDGNATYSVTVPNEFSGDFDLVAGITYLTGASGELSVVFFSQPVTVE